MIAMVLKIFEHFYLQYFQKPLRRVLAIPLVCGMCRCFSRRESMKYTKRFFSIVNCPCLNNTLVISAHLC